MAIVGKLDNENMIAGVGMGNAFIAIFGIAVFVGLNGALSTFIS